RHRLAVAGSTLMLLLLITATIVSTAQYLRAESELEARTKLNEIRHAEGEAAHTTTEFLRELFERADASTAGHDALTVRELLDRAGNKLDREAGQKSPAAEATLRMIVGNAYRKVGLQDRAEPH